MPNTSTGNVVGAGIGPDEKWALRSRQVLAMIAMAGQFVGLGPNQIPVLQGIGEHTMSLVALLLMVWHWWRPDGAELRLLPRATSGVVTIPLVVALAMPGCAFLGHKKASLEQQFYEVDAMSTLAITSAAETIGALRSEGIELPNDVRKGLLAASQSLRATRTEARAWIQACGPVGPCKNEERIRLAMDSMVSLATLVAKLVTEAKVHE